MFPFKQRGGLSFQANAAGEQEEDLILHQSNNNNTNHSVSASAGEGSLNNRSNNRRGRGRQPSSINVQDDAEKKNIHRDIERQRRQEMSNLYASLRNTLPAEYIKGKRAISDHVGEAANYIKDLERNVKELGEKRDQLRSSMEAGGGGGSSSSFSPVSIRQIAGGLEIEIIVDCEDKGFSLATALQIAHEEGLSVESYSSTKVHKRRFLHNLLCEVSSERTCIDLNRLQQRMINLVSK